MICKLCIKLCSVVFLSRDRLLLDFPVFNRGFRLRDVRAIRGSMRFRKRDCVSPTLLHVDSKPDSKGGRSAQGEQERETLPVVACFVDDSLDDINIGTYDAGGSVRKTEETEIQVVESGRRQFRHHRL